MSKKKNLDIINADKNYLKYQMDVLDSLREKRVQITDEDPGYIDETYRQLSPLVHKIAFELYQEAKQAEKKRKLGDSTISINKQTDDLDVLLASTLSHRLEVFPQSVFNTFASTLQYVHNEQDSNIFCRDLFQKFFVEDFTVICNHYSRENPTTTNITNPFGILNHIELKGCQELKTFYDSFFDISTNGMFFVKNTRYYTTDQGEARLIIHFEYMTDVIEIQPIHSNDENDDKSLPILPILLPNPSTAITTQTSTTQTLSLSNPKNSLTPHGPLTITSKSIHNKGMVLVQFNRLDRATKLEFHYFKAMDSSK